MGNIGGPRYQCRVTAMDWKRFDVWVLGLFCSSRAPGFGMVFQCEAELLAHHSTSSPLQGGVPHSFSHVSTSSESQSDNTTLPAVREKQKESIC